MKKKTKIAMATTAVAITSLMITAYHTEPPTPPVLPPVAPVSEVVEIGRATTTPTGIEPIVAEEIAEITNQTEEIVDPTPTEILPSKPIEVCPPTDTSTAQTKTSIKENDVATTTPKNGDTRIINGKQQGYLLGFGWVDNKGGNICEVADSDGDINKMVGSMY